MNWNISNYWTLIKQFSQYRISLLVLAVTLFLVSLPIQHFHEQQRPLDKVADQLQKSLQELAQDFYVLTQQEDLFRQIIEKSYTERELLQLNQKPYTLLIYQNKDLVFWNNVQAQVPDSIFAFQDTCQLAKLNNGYYQVIKESRPILKQDDTAITIVALQLIQRDYYIENKYLKNEFSLSIDLPSEVFISTEYNVTTEAAEIGKNIYQNQSFYLKYKDPLQITKVKVSYWALALQFASMLLMLVVLSSIAIMLLERYNAWYGFLFLVFSFYGIGTFWLHLPLLQDFHEVANFMQNKEANVLMFRSLINLLIVIALGFLVTVFFHRKVPITLSKNYAHWQKLAIFIGSLLLVLLGTYLIYYMTKVMILTFKVSFSTSNFVYPNTHTFLGLLILALSMVSFFALCQKIALVIKQLKVNTNDFWTSIGVVVCCFCFSFWLFQPSYNYLFVGVWMLIFVVLVRFFNISISERETNTRRLLLWAFLFSAFASVLLYSFGNTQEDIIKSELAQKRATNEDLVTESLISHVYKDIITDNVIQYYCKPSTINRGTKVIKRIEQKYLKNLGKSYDIGIHLFRQGVDKGKDILIASSKKNPKSSEVLNSELKNSTRLGNGASSFSLIKDEVSGEHKYLAKIPIFGKKTGMSGFLAIELIRKSYKGNTVYPELVIEDKYRENPLYSNYSYAVYENHQLQTAGGDYAYNHALASTFHPKEDTTYKENGFVHTAYITKIKKQTDGTKLPRETAIKIVLVSKYNNKLFEFLSLLAYLFTFAIVALLIVTAISSFFKTVSDKKRFKDLVFKSLQTRINLAMVIIISISVITIGGVTTYYFTQRSKTYHKGVLVQKIKEISIAVENALEQAQKKQSVNHAEYHKIIKRLENTAINAVQGKEEKRGVLNAFDIERKQLNHSQIDALLTSSKQAVKADFWGKTLNTLNKMYSMDMNIYDTDGQLIRSTAPLIFEKGIINKQMDSKAWFAIKHNRESRYIQNEQIGDLDYLAAYVPIFTNNNNQSGGQIVGYLNLPYFAKEKELRGEISDFLVALVSVYILIFLGASAITVFVSNSITRRLRMIGDELKQINVTKKNKQLEWEYDDEVGELVKQYNAAIIKLEQSVKLLAQSERENAWQQMARQVAHEIKNPLTPMKLSVQHLQRAYRADAADIGELTEKVTKTLIQQIDTLSQIATEFSNFAQMPQPKNEMVNLKSIVLGAANLYEETENVIIHKRMPKEDYKVLADKNQLIRVFNNLIKNATQAIPYGQQGIIVVMMKEAKGSLIVGVTDNGCGIEEEKRAKVFAPNFTTKNSGMGLGLAMSKNIIETARGKIWFESEVDEGTTFFVRLPLAKVPAYELVV